MKAKVLSGIMDALSSPEKHLGSLDKEPEPRELVSLEKLKEGGNNGVFVLVGVAALVPLKDRVP